MCGISGFCDFTTSFKENRYDWMRVLVNMRTSIAHRGNDQAGEYLEDHVGLAHARLSIRDISGGKQPIVRKVNGKDYVIVYNGEIYNTDEIVPSLKKAGYVFETTTDTEVILYAYIQYGMDFVSQLNGIFAFAIWDGHKENLLLYRDRLGVKPLFYTVKNGTLVFGSEIKALFCHPDVKPEADIDSFREIFGIGPAKSPGCGVFRNICEIKPGEVGTWSKDGLKTEKYWELKSYEHTDSYEETVEKVSFLVQDVIKRQMVSDVPVCSFLSGGIDSSIVTAVAANYLKEQGGTFNTFSFDFKDNAMHFKANAFQPQQDRPYVDKMLRLFDVNHTYLECDEESLVALLCDSLKAKDLPGMADIDTSLLYFCSLVKKQNKVALTGECSDEIFGGYPWFYREDLLNLDTFPWSRDITMRIALLKDEFIKELSLEEYIRARYEDTLKEVPGLFGEDKEQRRRREIAYLNIKWFMQTLLDRMDRASMFSGLEARVPFADHRILEYVFNVPWEMKYKNGVEKHLLRTAFRGLLPDELLFRKKSPYPKTYHPNYEQLLKKKFAQILKDPKAPIHTYIDKNKAEDVLKRPGNYTSPWFGQLMATPQMLAYIIQINEWLEKYCC
jgi:asparagine synthase (glutamine-hydrolysing)